MSFHINHNTPLEKEIKRILNELIDQSLQYLEYARQNTDQCIHEIRKNMKKGRAVLRLTETELTTEQFRSLNIFFRDISRELSSARDYKVIYDTIQKLIEKYGLSGMATSISQDLLKSHTAYIQQLKENNDKQGYIISTLEKSRSIIENLSIKSNPSEMVSAGLGKTYRKGWEAMNQVSKIPDATHFHEWRKNVKQLWYMSLLLKEISPSFYNNYESHLYFLSSLLGNEHDLATLKARVLSVSSGREASLISAILNEREKIQQETLLVGQEKIYHHHPEEFISKLKNENSL